MGLRDVAVGSLCGGAAESGATRRLGPLGSSLTALLIPFVVALALVSSASAAPFTGVELVKRLDHGEAPYAGISRVAGAEVKNGALYYLGGCDNRFALWRTDGTKRGTTRLELLAPTDDEDVYGCEEAQIINAGGTLYILVPRLPSDWNGPGSLDVWTSDGTAAGTKLVKPHISDKHIDGPELLTAAGADIYFSMQTEDHGWELWTSDGTAAGTGIVKDIIPGPTGAVGGRYNLEDRKFIFEDGHLYFTASPTEEDDRVGDVALFRTDGTAAGTEQLTPDADQRGGLAELDGRVYFWRQDMSDGSLELHAYEDGTVKEVADIVGDGNAMAPYAIWSGAGQIFVMATDATFLADNAPELWVSDGIPGGDTSFVKTLPSGILVPNTTVEQGGATIFAVDATSESTGDNYGLWRSDGSPAGTYRLGDVEFDPTHTTTCSCLGEWLPPGDYDGWITKSGGYVYFAGWDSDHGWELWRTDGTSGGTAPVVNINTGCPTCTVIIGQPVYDSDPRWLHDLGGRLLFTAAPLETIGLNERSLWRANHGNGVRIDGGGRGERRGAFNLALRVPRRPVWPTRMPAWLACKGGNCAAAVAARAIIRIRTGRGAGRRARTLKINLRPVRMRLAASRARGVHLRFKKHRRVARALSRLLRNRRRASGVVIVAARARSQAGADRAIAKMRLGPPARGRGGNRRGR